MPRPRSYGDYLASDGWRRRRWVVIQLARWTCQRRHWNVYARRGRWLEVHHRCYDRLGDELVGDVEVLCSVCHAAHHGKPLRSPRDRHGPWWIGDLLRVGA